MIYNKPYMTINLKNVSDNYLELSQTSMMELHNRYLTGFLILV